MIPEDKKNPESGEFPDTISCTIPVVSVIGWSGTGKTTLITRIIEELARRNIHTAAFKQIRHEVFEDKPGSDSRRFFTAGAQGTGLGTPDGAVFFLPDYQWTAEALRILFFRADLILCEGLRPPGVPVLQTTGIFKRPADLKGFSGDWTYVLTDDPELADMLHRDGISTLPQSDTGPVCEYLTSLIHR